MVENNSEQYKVAQKINDLLRNRFEVLVNIDKEEHYIGAMFPDVLLLDKKSRVPLFIIEIKKNGRIAACMQQWKMQSKIPATLYIVVPKTELESAKSVAAITGLNTRFGYYTLTETGEVSDVIFQ